MAAICFLGGLSSARGGSDENSQNLKNAKGVVENVFGEIVNNDPSGEPRKLFLSKSYCDVNIVHSEPGGCKTFGLGDSIFGFEAQKSYQVDSSFGKTFARKD